MIGFFTSSPSGPLDNSRKVLGLDEMNRFVENLAHYWPESGRALMITAFPDDDPQNDQMVDFFAGAIRDAGLPLETLDLWDHRASDTSRDALFSYGVVMLGGGHVVEISKPSDFIHSERPEVRAFLDAQFITRRGRWETPAP